MSYVMDPYELENYPECRKYTKKPEVIEAVQYKNNGPADLKMIADFMGVNELEISCADKLPQIRVHTIRGTVLVSLDDYIIKDRLGCLSSCHPEDFERLYELAGKPLLQMYEGVVENSEKTCEKCVHEECSNMGWPCINCVNNVRDHFKNKEEERK